VEIKIELKTSCSDTLLSYRLSQKFKLLGNGEFNNLINIITTRINKNKGKYLRTCKPNRESTQNTK